MRSITDTIKHLAGVPEDQLNKLLPLMEEVSIRRGNCFINAGQIPRKIAYVKEGLFRYFYIDAKGNQFTKGFFPEGNFITSYTAMVHGSPSHFAIQALEDSQVVSIDYRKWSELFDQTPEWQTFRLALIEKGFEKKERREREFLLLDASGRYQSFLQEFPGLEARIQQHLIASYLGITPVALSRIKKKLSR